MLLFAATTITIVLLTPTHARIALRRRTHHAVVARLVALAGICFSRCFQLYYLIGAGRHP
jgi:Na+/H+ antiporter NhaC